MSRSYPMGIDPGDLPHIVTLQKPTLPEERDAVGERIDRWTDVETIHAKVAPLKGSQQFLAAQMQASTTHLVTVRRSPLNKAMDASWRVNFEGRLLFVDTLPRNVDERGVWIQLSCTEGLQ